MTSSFAYCPHGFEVLARLRRLYGQRVQDEIFAVMEVPSRTLAQFAEQHAEGYCEYPDLAKRTSFWDAYLSERAAVFDDSVPSAYLSEMDQGLYGGLLGGDVRFLCDPATGWISSMVPPLLADWSGFDHLALDKAHPWFQRFEQQLGVFRQAAQGKFGISHFILISGLNFAFEVIGATQTYLDLTERPEMVCRAIELGYHVNVAVQDTFFHHVPLVEGGTCSNMVQWIPGRIVSESVDPFHMTSVADFERWGRDNVERIFAHFDGGVLHLHGNGRHLLPAVASLRGLKAVCLSDDRGIQPAFEFLPRAKQLAGNLPLIVGVNYAAFRDSLDQHRLPGGVLYRVQQVPDVSTANRCTDAVRAYRT